MTQTAAPVAPRHVAASSGRTVRVMGDQVTYKAVAEETGGVYSLFECRVHPGNRMPPHYQRYEDETFWVLEGELNFRLGDDRVLLGPGDYAFVPRGTVHGLANVGGVPGRFLLLVTPGGLHEKYLEEMGGARGVREAPASPAEVERVGMIAAKYGIEFLPVEGRLSRWDR